MLQDTISARIMKLIIMRHGEAETFRVPDKTRSLTDHGKQQSVKAGKWLAGYLGKGGAIDIGLVSSYARAQQTFEQLISQVSVDKSITCDDVVPEGDPKKAHDFVNALVGGSESIEVLLIVSHMPFVSYFLEEVHQDNQTMLFDTSSLVVVDYNVERGSGGIAEIYHPG